MFKKSILIITKDWSPIQAAHGRLAFDVAQQLLQEGHNVTVVTSSKNTGIFTEDGLTIHRVKPFLMPYRMRRIAKKIKTVNVVISLTQKASLMHIGNYVAKKKNAKHIQWIQDLYPEIELALGDKPKFRPSFYKRYLKSQKKCDHFVVSGRAMQSKIRQRHILPNKITHIPNWTNLHGTHLEKEAKTKEATSNYYDSNNIRRDDSPKFRIIYAGNLGRAHPVSTIVKAAEILKPHSEIEFIFIGDNHSNSKLASERDKKELNNIRFIPYQPTGHYQAILESGDLHLVTLRPEFEGLLVPCKFFSSLMVGRPVLYLGTHDSEIGRIIDEYKCGEVLELMNAQNLANAILKYRHDGQTWFKAQEGSINAALEYTPANSLSMWSNLIETI